MKKIGLISDTHGYLHPRVSDFFRECDEIWHAGDIGNIETLEKLKLLAPVRAVYGNIDGGPLRHELNEYEFFSIEGMGVLLIHIGGYPGRYESYAKQLIQKYQPGLFISGHSHILKVMPDKKNNLLYLNPGAAGKFGFHKVKTMMKLSINSSEIKDLEIFEAKR